MWPSGRATVFGTVDRRFESYHPSQLSPDQWNKQSGTPRVPNNAPVYAPLLWALLRVLWGRVTLGDIIQIL